MDIKLLRTLVLFKCCFRDVLFLLYEEFLLLSFAVFPNIGTTEEPERSAGRWNNRSVLCVCGEAPGMFKASVRLMFYCTNMSSSE